MRPYQADTVRRCVELISSAHRSHKWLGLLCILPCGAGKTEIAIELMHQAVAEGKRVAFVAHRKELILQSAARFDRADLECGIVMADYPTNPNAMVQVCSIQTVARRAKNLHADLFIIDEAHNSLSPTYIKRVIEPARSTLVPLIGLTATPYRLSPNECFSSQYTDWLVGIQPETLIKQGWQMRLDWFDNPEAAAIEVSKQRTGEFDEDQSIDAIKALGGIESIYRAYAKHAAGMKTIAFCVNIEHSKQFQRVFNALDGGGWALIHNEVSNEERAAAVSAFRDGRVKGLVNVAIISEGFDVPDCECVILACNTASMVKYKQACGRAQRPGKERAVLIDAMCHRIRLGLPWDDIVPQWWPYNDERQAKLEGRDPDPTKKEEETEDGGYLRIEKADLTRARTTVRDGWYSKDKICRMIHLLPTYGQMTVQLFGAVSIINGVVLPSRFGDCRTIPAGLTVMDAGIKGKRVWLDLVRPCVPEQEIKEALRIRKQQWEDYKNGKAQNKR